MLIKTDPDLIVSFLEDYSNIKGGFCSRVLFPETEAEVSDILSSASSSKTPVTLSGAGTGVTGGRIPFGGQVVSLEKMNKVLSIGRLASGGGIAVVEPGLMLEDFLKIIEEADLFYPPNPTEKSSSVGGNVATSASGARSFCYGTIRDYILGLRVVLTTGEILDIERGKIFADKSGNIALPLVSGKSIKFKIPNYRMPDIKNCAGYYARDGMDAIDLFIGQEGTLGVVTQVRLRLLKGLKGLLDCYVFFSRPEDALSFASRAREISLYNRRVGGGLNAISLEFFDKNTLNLLRGKHKNIPKDAEAAIFFEQEMEKETEDQLLESWSELILECNGSLDNTWFAQTKKERQELQDVRHDAPDMVNELIKKRGNIKIGTDIAVNPGDINTMINYYNKLLTEASLRFLIFGHIGDSHLHVNILPDNEAQFNKAEEVYEFFVSKAISLKGTVTAEHGIGKLKHRYLEMMYGPDGIREMVRIKKEIDPACILGLDNIFPKELLK